MEKHFGSEFWKEGDKVGIDILFTADEFICLYFGAHWCPPCWPFTTILSEVYNTINKEKKVIEVLFCTYDGSEDAFEWNFLEMPWLAFPFDDPKLKFFKSSYGVTGLPTLVVLDKRGNIVTYEGRGDVQTQWEYCIDEWRRKANESS